MLVVAAVYLLLAMEFTVRVSLCVNGASGCAQIEAGALGVFLHTDAVFSLAHGKPRAALRYGGRVPGRRPSLRGARPYLRAAAQAVRVRQARAVMRLGLEDACGTAIAAGAVRALAAALLSCVWPGVPLALRVDADFRAPCCVLAAQGIFSARPGDIMFAVLRAALKKKGKEGFGWRSIPLKA